MCSNGYFARFAIHVFTPAVCFLRRQTKMEGANNGRCHEARPEFDEFDVPDAALLPKLLIFMNDRGYHNNDVMPVVADVWREVGPNAVDEIAAVELHSHAQQPVRKQRALYSAEALRESVEGSSTQSVAVLVQSPVLSCHYACVVFESRTNRGFIFDPLHRAAMIADASSVLRAMQRSQSPTSPSGLSLRKSAS